jgi:hypothetical protein
MLDTAVFKCHIFTCMPIMEHVDIVTYGHTVIPSPCGKIPRHDTTENVALSFKL